MTTLSLALLSDTHQAHRRLDVPAVDLVAHCGDWAKRGDEFDALRFLDWFAELPARAHVFIAGNHDYFAEQEPEKLRALTAERGLVYLEDESAELLGLRIWGSPVTPRFRNMAFNRERGSVIRTHWDGIPRSLDLLLTHAPPRRIGDRTLTGLRVGCEDLRDVVLAREPRIHAFGHIHESRGEHSVEGSATRFLNVANRGLRPGLVRPPTLVELEVDAHGAAA